MITLAVATIMEAAPCSAGATIHCSPDRSPGDRPLPLPGASLQPQMLWVLGVGWRPWRASIFYRRMMLGQAMLACSINPEAAASVGIRGRSCSAFVRAVSGAVGGVLIAPITSTELSDRRPDGCSRASRRRSSAGSGSSLGAVVGGLAWGCVSRWGPGSCRRDTKDAIALGLLVVFLVLRRKACWVSGVAERGWDRLVPAL
jgi:branched-chain amino acid transport system permease protein